jgi:hypothetical protein
MASENLSDDQSASVRFLLLLLGEVSVGAFLYFVFMFVTGTVQALIAFGFWVVGVCYDFEPPRTKSLATLLCAITGGLTALCSVALRIPRLRVTHEDVLFRLMLVGICLMGGLIFPDRRLDA